MEENEKKYATCFQIIVDAGDARTKALQAVKAANEDKIQKAESILREARECLKKAHRSQTELIQKEAVGEGVEVNIIMVHSQDHFSMAMTSIDIAEEVIFLNKKISRLLDK